jgi:hypothetical protein
MEVGDLFYCSRCRREFHVADLSHRWDCGEDIIIVYCPNGHPICAVAKPRPKPIEAEEAPSKSD